MGEFSLGFSLITKYLSDRLNRRFFRAIFWKRIWNSLIIFFLGGTWFRNEFGIHKWTIFNEGIFERNFQSDFLRL